jgi:hypothetical protein
MSKIKTWTDISEDRILVDHNDGVGGMLIQTSQFWNPYKNLYESAYLVHCDEFDMEDPRGLKMWMPDEVHKIYSPQSEVYERIWAEGELEDWMDTILDKAKFLLG